MPGLRAGLKAKGLTVRTHEYESQVKKFPKLGYKAIMGGGEGNTLINGCIHFMSNAIASLEMENGKELKRGIIADFSGNTKKMLVIVRLDADMLEHIRRDAPTVTVTHDFTKQEKKCEVIGEIVDSKPKFYCDEIVTKTFFDSLGKPYSVTWHDAIEEKENAEKEALKAQRKQAKKHRRQVTASTLTSTSDKSFASAPQESNEAVKARQREKNKAKKKAQQGRKKTAAIEEAATETTNTTLTTGGDAKKSKLGEDLFRFFGLVGNNNMMFKDQDNKHIIRPTSELNRFEPVDEDEPDVEKFSLVNEDGTSGDTSEEDEGGTGLRIIHAEDMDAVREAFDEGGDIFMMSPAEGDDEN